jgi:hypothetical protein
MLTYPYQRRYGMSQSKHTSGPSYESSKVMDDSDDFTQLDDFQVIAERRRVAEMLAALTDRYRRLNQEMNRRVTLQWMVP